LADRFDGGGLNNLRDELIGLLTPVVSDQGMQLWELECNARASGGLLRIYIDSPAGVTVEDCERVSRAISAELDVDDPIPGHYTLEVSSPGLDRVLRTREHFARFVGASVRIETTVPIGGRKRFTGRLLNVDALTIEVEVEGRAVTISLTTIRKARLTGDVKN
jgi:ribosome maturation factor RimP